MARNQTVSFGAPGMYAPTPLGQALRNPQYQFGAQTLQAATDDEPVLSVGYGLTKLGRALAGGYFMNQGQQAERTRTAEGGQRLAAAISSNDPRQLAALAADPDLQAVALPYLQAAAQRSLPAAAPAGMRYNADRSGLEDIPGYREGQRREYLATHPITEAGGQPYDTSALMPGGGAGGAAQAGAPSAPAGPAAAAPGAPNPTNPGNMRVPGQTAFQSFRSPEEGVAGMVRQLGLYAQRGITTPLQIAQTWAPRGDGANDPAAYARAIQQITGLDPNQPVDLSNPDHVSRLVGAMAQVEQGRPLDPSVLQRGLSIAPPGVGRQPLQPMAGAPSTMPGRMPGQTPVQVAQAGPQTATDAQGAAPPPPVSALIPDRAGATAAPLPMPEPSENLTLRRNPGALLPGPSREQIGQARSARQEHFGQPEVRNALRVTTVLRSMEDTMGRNTAASDLDLVYGLMTILDPSSVVREGETVMVRGTQSVPDQIRGTVDRLLNGGAALGDEGRRAIMDVARSRAAAQMETYRGIRRTEETFLRSANLNPAAVLGQAFTLPEARRAQPTPVPPPPTVAPTLPPGTTPADVQREMQRRGLR